MTVLIILASIMLRSGFSAWVPVTLTSNPSVAALTFDLHCDAVECETVASTKYYVRSVKLGGGYGRNAIRVIVYHTQLLPVEGEIAKVKVKVPTGLSPGPNPVVLNRVIVSGGDAFEYRVEGSTSNVGVPYTVFIPLVVK